MSDYEPILDIYRSISEKSGQMLDAARSGDWERLVALEQDCRALIERLKQTRVDPDLGAQFMQRKNALIHKALADDAAIRKLTEPWMTQLQAYLGSACQEQKLHRAYETDHGG